MNIEGQQQTKLQILLVDDDEEDYIWIRRTLAGEEAVHIDWAASYEEGCTAIRECAHDVILVDFWLQDEYERDGLDIVRQARTEHANTPCILFTGVHRVGLEIASLSAGAAGFLTKSELSASRLMHAILQALERGKTDSELFRKNRALEIILRATEAANQAVSEQSAFAFCLQDVVVQLGWNTSDALLVHDATPPTLLAAHASEPAQQKLLADLRVSQLRDAPSNELNQVMQSRELFICHDLAAANDPGLQALAQIGLRSVVLLPVTQRSEVLAVMELYSHAPREPEPWETEVLTAVAAQLAQTVVRARAEIERAGAELALRRSQRLDALGRLAGGVAHDFNNLLTVITASAGLLLELPPERREDGPIETMRDAAERGARLTRQLLALGSKNVVAAAVVEVNALIRSNETLLRRTLREDIELRFELRAQAAYIEIDPSQFEQLLLNLVLNARDAIEGHGTLTITSEVVTQTGGAQPLVRVGVSDTGTGISPDALEHVFDPFFTTKAAGQGTGLGLFSVYSAVTQAGGTIQVESEPGVGTQFQLYFPRKPSKEELPGARNAPEAAVRGGMERILLVEDDPAVRSTAALVLESYGYRVLIASRPDEALTIARREKHIHLVLTDVVMPDMSGVELAIHLSRLHPGVPILFMSGYPQAAVEKEGLLDVSRRLLPKPFTARELALHVRKSLDDAMFPLESASLERPHH